MSTDIKITAAQQAQSKSDKRSALDLLKSKKRKTKELTILVDEEEVTLKFASISSTELDKLRAKHPPNKTQQANGMGVNTDTFAPALVAATLVEPAMSEDEARELWQSDYWSTGELSQLFDAASSLCLEGMDVPLNGTA